MKKGILKILESKPFLMILMVLGMTSIGYSSELNFEALKEFGEVPIYLAVLVEIIQKLIVSLVLVGIISDVLEVVANADFSKLLRSTIMGMLYIYVSTVLIRIIIKIGGVGGTNSVNTSGNVLYTNFKIIFRFLGWVQYTTAGLVISVGILFFIVGIFKFVATADIVQLIQSLIMTGLFLAAFVGIIGKSINFDDGGNPKELFKKTGNNGILVSAKEIDEKDVKNKIFITNGNLKEIKCINIK